MLWLPQRIETQAVCRLPLADFSAPALLSAIAADNERSTELVCEAIRHDAALALWVVCAPGCAGGDKVVPCVDELAHWLVSNCRDALVWPNVIEQTPDDAAWREDYRRLAAVSVAVAKRASQLAIGDSETTERAFLLGLLHAAERWHSLDPRSTAGGEGCRALPAWLSESLERVSHVSIDDSDPAVRCVARALESLDEGTALAECDRLAASREASAAALAAVARCLPAVTKRFSGSLAAFDFDSSVEAAKLSAMAEFAAGAGHEINNPIAVIAGRAQLLLEGETNPQRRHELAVMHSQAMRVYEMIADMMLFARPPAPKFAPCDLAAILHKVADEIRGKAMERGVDVHLAVPEGPIVVQADAVQLSVVVRVLCDNALAAVPGGGFVSIQLRVAGNGKPSGNEIIMVEISDNGCGITAEIRQHLFDPFFSGREAGRGLGMGLAKAWRIVQNHQGRIVVASQAGRGTTFTLALPPAH